MKFVTMDKKSWIALGISIAFIIAAVVYWFTVKN